MDTNSMRSKMMRLIAAGGIVGASLLAPAAAHAAYAPGDPGTGGQGGAGSNGANGSGSGSSGGDTLPFTGGDALGVTLLGLGTLAGGTALVVMSRRRTAEV